MGHKKNEGCDVGSVVTTFVPMCITSLDTELLRLIEEGEEKPVSERGKTHTFPNDLYLAPSSGFQGQFYELLNNLIQIPKPPQKVHQKAYRAVYEQIILNLSRCVITRLWLCIAGSNIRDTLGQWKYGPNRCHIYQSERVTKAILKLLIDAGLVFKNTGAAFEKGYVEDHYYPTRSLAMQLVKFSPFVEQNIVPSSKHLKINDPDEAFEGFKWSEDHQDVKDIITINEFARHQSWTLKAPIRQTFNGNPFTVGRLITPFQNLPSRDYEIRLRTIINGNPIAEVDFNANHLRIYLAYLGKPYEGSDPYAELADIAGVSRREVKGFMTVAMNCSSLKEAKGAALSERVSHQTSEKISKAFQRRFKGVELHSGFGVYAMNYEGLILKDVMLQALAKDIFTLPIHDAVACETQHSEVVNQIMLSSWEKIIQEIHNGNAIKTVTKVSTHQIH